MDAGARTTDCPPARLPPSAAQRWIACPGSVRLSSGIDGRAGSDAVEGSAAREVAARCLEERRDAADLIGWRVDARPASGSASFSAPDAPPDPADGGTSVEIDEEMAEAVQLYLDHVRTIYAADGASMLVIEQRLDMTDLHPHLFGTGDAAVYLPGARALHVVDFAFGKGQAVEVGGNPQLLLYGAGAARRHHNLPIAEVVLHVVQPRAPHPDGPVRSHPVDLLDLLDFEAEIRAAAAATDAPDAPLRAGEHCRSCPAAGSCPAYRAHAFALAGLAVVDDVPVLPPPAEMTPEQRGRVLGAAARVPAWIRAVQQAAHAAALAGRMPEGFKLVARRATRRWREGDEILDRLQLEMGLADEDVFERKMRSPAQLERHFPGRNAAERRAAMAPLVTAAPSGTNLVPLTDPRPAVTPEAAQAFGA